MATSLESFIRGIPKAELHLHIEGTLEPELVFALAAKHGVALAYASVEELRQYFNRLLAEGARKRAPKVH